MDKSEFGKLLTKLRQRDNMTQADLANALGVSISAVSKWENGKNYPDIPVFSVLKDLFHLSFDDLHHPDRTLFALEQGILLPLEERVQENTSTQKGRKTFLLPALLIVILFLFGTTIFSTVLLLRSQYSPDVEAPMVSEVDSDSFKVITAGASRDETIHQDVYEITLVYKKSSTSLSEEIWYEEFNRRSEEWWTEHPDTSVTCLKITAYFTVPAALRNNETDYVGYSYRYTRLRPLPAK